MDDISRAAETSVFEKLRALPLREGYLRWVHITGPEAADSIAETGLQFSKQRMLMATAHRFDTAGGAAEHLIAAQRETTDPRFRFIGDKAAVIMDIPKDLTRLYDDMTTSPGLVDPSFVRAVVVASGRFQEFDREPLHSEKVKRFEPPVLPQRRRPGHGNFASGAPVRSPENDNPASRINISPTGPDEPSVW